MMQDTCMGCPYGARLQEGDFCFLGTEIDNGGERLLVFFGKVEGPCEEIDRCHAQALQCNEERQDEEEVDDLLDDLFAKIDQ